MACLTAAAFLERNDSRDVGDLVSDTGTTVSAGDLLSDTNLATAIEDAQGTVDAALQFGGRYTSADLAALTTTQEAYLNRIETELCMYFLLARRPSYSTDQLEYYAKLKDELLDPLRKGEEIFPSDAAIEASKADVDGPSVVDYEQNYNLWRDRTKNYYPRRNTIRNR